MEHLGPDEVRVCEVDFYRLNPDIKPKTAASLERIAQFSKSVSFSNACYPVLSFDFGGDKTDHNSIIVI